MVAILLCGWAGAVDCHDVPASAMGAPSTVMILASLAIRMPAWYERRSNRVQSGEPSRLVASFAIFVGFAIFAIVRARTPGWIQTKCHFANAQPDPVWRHHSKAWLKTMASQFLGDVKPPRLFGAGEAMAAWSGGAVALTPATVSTLTCEAA